MATLAEILAETPAQERRAWREQLAEARSARWARDPDATRFRAVADDVPIAFEPALGSDGEWLVFRLGSEPHWVRGQGWAVGSSRREAYAALVGKILGGC